MVRLVEVATDLLDGLKSPGMAGVTAAEAEKALKAKGDTRRFLADERCPEHAPRTPPLGKALIDSLVFLELI